MKIVLDCNIIVSAALSDGICRQIILIAIREHEIVVSGPIIDEYVEIANRPKFTRYRDQLLGLIKQIQLVAVVVEPEDICFEIADPDDEVYLTTAAAGDAAVITGNTKDFSQPYYGLVKIFTPRAFVEAITIQTENHSEKG